MFDFVSMADPATREVTRRHRDDPAFAAIGWPHSLAVWSRHPNVHRSVERDGARDGEIADAVWQRNGFASERAGTPRRIRPGDSSDDQFAGARLTGDAFWARHPDATYAGVLNFLGDDSLGQDSWRAPIWLKDA